MLTNVYVDGFNLYYGCLRRSPYKWLDLGELCAKLLPGSQIHRIRYFTARIKARPSDPDAPNRQEAYLAALGSIPVLSLHYGHFLASRTTMLLVAPPPGASPFVRVHKTEEKGSDVNLATWMLTDAFERDCEQVVLVTNDSDLAEPMRIVAQRQGMPVGLINPHPRKASRALLNQRPVFVKEIRPGVLASSQFPDRVRAGNRTLHRPATW
jgi:uncharacterized LabA/DUF88 family protein